jgi:AraC family transcriptional regulator
MTTQFRVMRAMALPTALAARGASIASAGSPASAAELAISEPAAASSTVNRVIVFPAPRAPVPAPLESSFQAPSLRPADIVRRQCMAWPGLVIENVQVTRHEPFEYEFRAPFHLLIAYERASRVAGETFLEGLPRSSLRDFSRKLTFVPAGTRFYERQTPRTLLRAAFLRIDAREPVLAQAALAPRLFFDDAALWQTVQKLKVLADAGSAANTLYAEALGAVLRHELARLSRGAPPHEPPIRGGLAGWQRRIVTQYVDENLAEPISLATLAELARLSPFHFARAFKQSFGLPPHGYHTNRRIEEAKALLAMPARSVTEIALDVGFSETSSFSAAFRKLTKQTPTEYRRRLI